MRSASSFRIVFTTSSNLKNAAQIARSLVATKAAACVNIIPKIQSIYRWKGKIEKTSEFLLLIKTRRRNLGAVERIIRRHHIYEVPEIIAVPLDQGSPSYLKWLATETNRKGRK